MTTPFFSDVVLPDAERISIVETEHTEAFRGQTFTVRMSVHRVVLTDFDRLLSRHLAATTRKGFPAYVLTGHFRPTEGSEGWQRFKPAFHQSAPHALKAVAERAEAYGDGTPVRVRTGDGDRTVSSEVTSETVAALGEALAVARTLGEPEFLEITGGFDRLMVRPAEGDVPAVTLDLTKGSASVPSAGLRSTPFECPLFGFAKAASGDVSAAHWLGRVREAVALSKADSVSAFRYAAEHRIMDFDRALAGRALDGHRLSVAEGLVARLRQGLGNELRGLAEHARLTALDWALDIESAADPDASDEPRIDDTSARLEAA